MSKKDACYYRAKAKYEVTPSARASQFIAKCRKKSGHVRKTQAGTNLKRWQNEKWKNTKTGRTCGNSKDKHEYCRPTIKISKKTPKLHPKNIKTNQRLKNENKRAKVAT
tara:strand:+ start:258 stop:584 length:327 start_codon:yes stop_codon:yes gene_type:complete